MSSLRKRFVIAILALLAASTVLQSLAISSARSSLGDDGLNSQPSLTIPTVLSTLATFCVGSAIVLVIGIVALLVVDEALLRKLEIDADAEEWESGESGSSAEGGAVPAYGSDPELL